MAVFPAFPEGQIEALARVLGECGSGTDVSRVLHDRCMADDSGESTKWRRLYSIFLDCQRRDGCANRVVDFIQSFLIPSRFVGRIHEFEQRRLELNTILAFSGLEYGKDGKFRHCNAVQTLDEAEQRVQTLRAKFQGRRIHPEVLKYCRAELLQDNYFHAVFEASKGLAQRIREMSGIHTDGAALVDRVFSIERPVVAFNTLQTETEKSEHKGFASLLKGCFAAVRNPLAHEPKVLWQGEDDAADYLSLISLLHRKLDECVLTGLA
ncbi:TIGR02391 family protein [Geobacter sulfurreducens]|uniref:TIGR02391 family protein n=1 Tax=Geobacter sulfurreducens TaxID=35554 RepID=UPI001BDC77ED|nr:TIGR02391 family protein [Geobacter sulfurreducens]QVW35317.1 TIGR02391 family protein [Geobacter sulfurreducens]